MSEHDRMDPDGILSDGVPFDSGIARLPIYLDVRRQLTLFKEPVFAHANNPHERLYVAALDGTGNDLVHDPEHATNVGLIAKQIQASGNPGIGGGYLEGPGTQQRDPFGHLFDGMLGYSVDERAEQMYKFFIEQAKQWQHEDPVAKISVVSVSFSRGGEVAALFARLVDERGIQDPSGAVYAFDAHHQIKHVEYTRPALVPPHEVAQGVTMFDPVATGHAMHEDRRLPPSVLSGIQLIALDEHRSLFKSDHIIDPGITTDGRFAGVYVPGAHSDVGGGYHRDGMSIQAGNLAIDYINGFSDVAFLAKRPEADDPRLTVIHHSEVDTLLYRLTPKVNRLETGGYNEREVPWHETRHVADPYNAEPRDEILSQQFERQGMPNGPLPTVSEQNKDVVHSELDQWIERMYQASQQPDDRIWDQAGHAAAQDYMCTPAGQWFQQQADDLGRTRDLSLQAQYGHSASQAMQDQALQQSQGFCR